MVGRKKQLKMVKKRREVKNQNGAVMANRKKKMKAVKFWQWRKRNEENQPKKQSKFVITTRSNSKKNQAKSPKKVVTINLIEKEKYMSGVALCRPSSSRPKDVRNKSARKTREAVHKDWLDKTSGVCFNTSEQCVVLPVETFEIPIARYKED